MIRKNQKHQNRATFLSVPVRIRAVRFFSLSMIVLLVVASPVMAWVNVAITAAELAAPFVVNAGVKYFLPSASTVNVPTYGRADGYNIKRNSVASYGGIGKAAVITLGAIALMEYVKSRPSSYPGLYSSALPHGVIASQTDKSGNTKYNLRWAGTQHLNWSYNTSWLGWSMASRDRSWYLSNQGYGPGTFDPAVVPETGSIPIMQYISGSNGNWTITDYVYSDSPDTSTAQTDPATFVSQVTNPDGTIKESIRPEIDTAIQSSPNSWTFPTSDVIQNTTDALADGQVGRDAQNRDILQQRKDAAQQAYDANPTEENKKALDDATMQLNDFDSGKSEENATPDPVSDSVYDSNIDVPEKKDIKSLITGFLAASPLVSIIKQFRIDTTSHESSLSVSVWGQTIQFDFSRWLPILSTVGSALLTVTHIYAVYIVFRNDS